MLLYLTKHENWITNRASTTRVSLLITEKHMHPLKWTHSQQFVATRDGDTPILYSPQEYIWKAESWVEKLNPEPEVDEDNIYEELLHNRPARLGLGAKFIPHSQFTAVLDPVGKKLQAKLNYAKKGLLNDDTQLFSASNNNKRTRSNWRRDPDHDENSDDDPDSRSGAFKKKQTKFLSASSPTTKKVRKN